MNNGFFGFPLADLNKSAGEKVNVSGRLLRISRFTSSGNWVKQKDVGFIIVELLGGGGGGGGAKSESGPSYGSAGASGAGGGGCRKYILATSLGATEAVSIGAGGTAGASTPTDGSTGGTSYFGAFCSASGGQGGQACIINQPTTAGSTAQGGIGTGGDVNWRGGSGFQICSIADTISPSFPGGNGAMPIGGSGAMGQMNKVIADSFTGLNADANSGGGGSGGLCKYSTNDTRAGGTGGSGLCVVYEYS